MAMARCGWVTIDRRFVGRYELEEERSFPKEVADATADEHATSAVLRMMFVDQYANFVVQKDRIRSGKLLVQEFCFVEVRTETDHVFDAAALWHEDVHDPGDARIIYVRFERNGDEARFNMYAEAQDRRESAVFLRAAAP